MDLKTFSTEVMKRLKKISTLDIMQEMQHIAHPVTWESLISVNVKPVFDKYDPDVSGFLDEDELNAMLMEVDNSETKQVRLQLTSMQPCMPCRCFLRCPCCHSTAHTAHAIIPLPILPMLPFHCPYCPCYHAAHTVLPLLRLPSR
jgi:hypothetical protein